MIIKDISEKDRKDFNSVVNHPLQSFEWGEFRKKTGVKVVRKEIYDKDKLIGGFQLTIHKIPHFPFTIGYLPKGNIPTQEVINELIKIGKEEKCIFIQLEPNAQKSQISNSKSQILDHWKLPNAAHPLFSKYTFILDLTKSEEEYFKNMHPKTRYNIKIAQKNNVKIVEDNSKDAFEEYLSLTKETAKRQGFFAHTPDYHKKMWETLKIQNSKFKIQNYENRLTAHLFLAKYTPPSSNSELTLAAWILFIFKDTLYYPYGSSSTSFRNVMASNLIMFEAVKFGKKMGLKKFDMWGSLSQNPDKNDPWYGFHRFKEGYGPELVEFVGSYDLIIKPVLYQFYKRANKLRWALLKFKKAW